MRQRLNFYYLLIGCALTLALAGCAQPISVGILTPNAATAAAQVASAQAVAASTAAAAAAVPTAAPTLPPPTQPPPQPSPTTGAPAEAPTVTSVPPTPAPAPAPSATPAPTSAPAADNTGSGSVACNQVVVYVVKPGDNLFRIALRYRTTIYAIARQNGISNTRVIRVGQRLRITTCLGR